MVGELEQSWKDFGSYSNWGFSKQFKKILDTGGDPELNTYDVLW